MVIFNKGFNRKILGLGSLARLTNLDLEARSPRLSIFSKGFVKKMIGSGRLARWGNLDLKIPDTENKGKPKQNQYFWKPGTTKPKKT